MSSEYNTKRWQHLVEWHGRKVIDLRSEMCSPPKTARFALRAEHESRPWRKAVFDGLRICLAGGLVNEFPARHQCTTARFAPFALSDTKSLAASRKRPLCGLHEKAAFATADGVREFRVNSCRAAPVSCPARRMPRSGAAMALPCAGACPLAQGRALPHGGGAALRR